MPKVREYGGPKQSRQVVRGPRANVLPKDAFGLTHLASLAKDTANIADKMRIDQERAQQEADRIEASDLLNKFNTDVNRLNYAPEEGYYHSQGKDAYERSGLHSQTLKELQENYLSQLSSEGAKGLFKSKTDVSIMSNEVKIMNHAQRGLQQYEDQTRQAVIEDSIESAGLVFPDRQLLEEHYQNGLSQIASKMDKQGIDFEDPVFTEAMQNYSSKFHGNAIEKALIKEGPDSAQGMINELGFRLEDHDKSKLQAKIDSHRETINEAQESERLLATAHNLFDKHNIHGEPWFKNAVEEARKTLKGEERKDVVGLLNTMKINQDKIDAEAGTAAFDKFENSIYSGASWNSVFSDDPELKQELKDTGKFGDARKLWESKDKGNEAFLMEVDINIEDYKEKYDGDPDGLQKFKEEMQAGGLSYSQMNKAEKLFIGKDVSSPLRKQRMKILTSHIKQLFPDSDIVNREKYVRDVKSLLGEDAFDNEELVSDDKFLSALSDLSKSVAFDKSVVRSVLEKVPFVPDTPSEASFASVSDERRFNASRVLGIIREQGKSISGDTSDPEKMVSLVNSLEWKILEDNLPSDSSPGDYYKGLMALKAARKILESENRRMSESTLADLRSDFEKNPDKYPELINLDFFSQGY